MKCCINGGNSIRYLVLSMKLLKFETKKCGQILCAHKPYFLMPGHIYIRYTCMYNNDIHSALHGCVKCLITQVLH